MILGPIEVWVHSNPFTTGIDLSYEPRLQQEEPPKYIRLDNSQHNFQVHLNYMIYDGI